MCLSFTSSRDRLSWGGREISSREGGHLWGLSLACLSAGVWAILSFACWCICASFCVYHLIMLASTFGALSEASGNPPNPIPDPCVLCSCSSLAWRCPREVLLSGVAWNSLLVAKGHLAALEKNMPIPVAFSSPHGWFLPCVVQARVAVRVASLALGQCMPVPGLGVDPLCLPWLEPNATGVCPVLLVSAFQTFLLPQVSMWLISAFLGGGSACLCLPGRVSQVVCCLAWERGCPRLRL